MPSKKLTRYPAVELLRFFDREMSSSDIGDALGIDSTQVRRWRSRGITLSAFDADRYAMSIGLHPSSVWPDLWWRLDG